MLNVNFLSAINPTSYGLVGSYFLLGMLQRGVKASLFPIGQPIPTNQNFQQAIQIALRNSQTFDIKSPSLRMFHQHSMGERVGSPAIGFTIFELNKLKSVEIHNLSTLDLIISPTKWQDEIIKAAIPNVKTTVVPLGVDTNIFKPIPIDRTNKPFVYVAGGKWELRKNQALLIKAFDRAFTPSDDVELHLICHSFLSQEIQKRGESELNECLRLMTLNNKVRVYKPEFIPFDQLARIYNFADCGVSISSAEGWGLFALEMMAVGKNLIVSNCTGHTEFVNENCGKLIDSVGMEKAQDDLFFDGFGQWHKFDMDQIIEALRFAYKNWRDQTNQFNIEQAKKFAWNIATDKLIKVLKSPMGVYRES